MPTLLADVVRQPYPTYAAIVAFENTTSLDLLAPSQLIAVVVDDPHPKNGCVIRLIQLKPTDLKYFSRFDCKEPDISETDAAIAVRDFVLYQDFSHDPTM